MIQTHHSRSKNPFLLYNKSASISGKIPMQKEEAPMITSRIKASYRQYGAIGVVLGSFLFFGLGTIFILSQQPQSPSFAASGSVKKPIPGQLPAATAPDVSTLDPFNFLEVIPVGKPAPDFKVTDADGSPVQLSQFKGKKNVVLVFYQGHFCHVCGAQLSNFQKHFNLFQQQDADILAISADDKSLAEQTLGEKGLSFHIIPDPQKVVINRFGVSNIAKKGIAWPSVYVVDKKGVVRFSYADYDGKRLHSGDILPVLSKITGKPAPKIGYDD